MNLKSDNERHKPLFLLKSQERLAKPITSANLVSTRGHTRPWAGVPAPLLMSVDGAWRCEQSPGPGQLFLPAAAQHPAAQV